MEGDPGRTVSVAELVRKFPGMVEGVPRAHQISMEPHIEYDLQGVMPVPLIHPGSRAIDSAIAAGDSIPQVQYIPDSVVVRSDFGLDIVEGAHALPEQLLTAIGSVNQAVAAREISVSKS